MRADQMPKPWPPENNIENNIEKNHYKYRLAIINHITENVESDAKIVGDNHEILKSIAYVLNKDHYGNNGNRMLEWVVITNNN